MRPAQFALTALACACLAGCQNPPGSPPDFSGPTSGWPSYGGQNSQHYSALDQINRANVEQLKPAWTHHSGDVSDGRSGDWGFSSLQVTPIVTNNSLYYCTPFGRVFSLDPETGAERWVFDPQLKNKRSGLYPLVCRGVSYWENTGTPLPACNKRILYGTRDAELIALDADTGLPCQDFANSGRQALHTAVPNPAAMQIFAAY